MKKPLSLFGKPFFFPRAENGAIELDDVKEVKHVECGSSVFLVGGVEFLGPLTEKDRGRNQNTKVAENTQKNKQIISD